MTTQQGLYDVFNHLHTVIPTDLWPSFAKLRSKLIYTAPELIGERWHQLHHLLVHASPDGDDPPDWVRKASEIWNNANQGSASRTNTAPGSSLE